MKPHEKKFAYEAAIQSLVQAGMWKQPKNLVCYPKQQSRNEGGQTGGHLLNNWQNHVGTQSYLRRSELTSIRQREGEDGGTYLRRTISAGILAKIKDCPPETLFLLLLYLFWSWFHICASALFRISAAAAFIDLQASHSWQSSQENSQTKISSVFRHKYQKWSCFVG